MFPPSGGAFWCAFLPFFVVVVHGPPTTTPPCANPGNFRQAKQCCSNKGTNLPDTTSVESLRLLRIILKEQMINSTWVRTKREMMSNWKWIDGVKQELDHWIPKTHGCGWFNQKSKRVETGPCTERTVGSICSFKVSKCPSGILSHIGVSYRGVCYVHHCERLTWHEARAHCQIQGQALAIVRESDIAEALGKKPWACYRFWVGLRAEDLTYNIIYDHWNPHHHPDTGCGRVQMTDTSWEFKPENCNSTRPYICNTTKTEVTTTMPVNSTLIGNQNTELESGYTRLTFTLISCGIGIVLVCAVAFLIICIHKKRRRRRTKTDAEIKLTETGHLIGSEEFISKSLQRDVARAILRIFNRTEVWDWEDERVSVKLDRLYTDLVYAEWTYSPLGPEEKHLDVYTDMFSQGESAVFPYRVYIEGAAGTGKTTLAKRLLVDWARYILAGWWRKAFLIPLHIHRQLGQFDLVLPIFLRNVSDGQSLAEALIQNLDMDTDERYMKDIIEKNQTRILILCEGMDEYREETSSDITTFLKRGKMKRTSLLITSRNGPRLHFKTETEFPTTHIILKGFSQKGVQTYTDRFFQGTRDAQQLRREINKSEDRKDLSQYPAVLLLMCVLWRDNKTIADSVTEFYFDFLKYICARYERKFLADQDRSSPEEIVHTYHDYVMEIGAIAANGLKGDTLELTFDHSVITGMDDVTRN